MKYKLKLIHQLDVAINYNRRDRRRPTALLPPRSYGKQEAAAAVDRLLMMGIRMPETCWAVSRRQTI